MRRQILTAAAWIIVLATPAAAGQQAQPHGLRIGNAGYGGSESLLDNRTTGAEFSGGTRAGTHPQFGSIVGPDGLVLPLGEIRGDSTRRLLAPGTTGADGSGGTSSPTTGAGGR